LKNSWAFFLIARNTASPLEPVVAIVIRIDKRNTELLRKPNVFAFAQFLFLERVNVRVIEEEGEVDTRRLRGFHYFA
jgi:hypothetical protein